MVGSVKNNLGVDLHEVVLVYGTKCYELPDCRAGGGLQFDLGRGRAAELGAPRAAKGEGWVKEAKIRTADLGTWAQQRRIRLRL